MTTTHDTDGDKYEQQIQEIVRKSFQLGQQDCPPTTIINKHIRDSILRLLAITIVNWLIHELTAYYYIYAADDPSSTTSTRNRATDMRNVRDRFRRFSPLVMIISILGIAWHKELAFRFWFGWNITRFLRFFTGLMAWHVESAVASGWYGDWSVALEVMSMPWTIVTSLKIQLRAICPTHAFTTEERDHMNDLRYEHGSRETLSGHFGRKRRHEEWSVQTTRSVKVEVSHELISLSPRPTAHEIHFPAHKAVLNRHQHAVDRDTDNGASLLRPARFPNADESDRKPELSKHLTTTISFPPSPRTSTAA
ncbi:hypothetical protein BDZ85DRAFT_253351 [Elsinoe ampelina]|uniref:Uncharacterized protein n=1 Tax=Elsinoe ampelina TaxID=302913 RepID=A0A6A6FZG7_9PEZI|nr:hypothetical protein BDZ85DRAFT_253351 [Elsinoe ampelina]